LASDIPQKYDVAVIGAGAAGMMAAATAGQRGRRVVLIDHYGKVGEKIRISGGGRCNFTNIHATHRNFLSRNPDFARSALARYTPRDFIALVEKHGIAYHEKTLGQLFCDESSRQIIEMMMQECRDGAVEWRQPCAVTKIGIQGTGARQGRFRVDTDAGPLEVESLVIATGGLTVPKIGATPFGYRIAEQFGLAIVPPRPALVPLSFDPELLARYGDLSGVSVDAETWCRNGRFRENLLFTHRGLSGPSILQVSSYWQQAEAAEPIHVDLLPGIDVRAWFAQERRSRSTPAALLGQRLPKRFAQQWSEAQGVTKPMVELSDRAIEEAARALSDWRVQPSGTLGYNKAEVTLGGVDTRGLSSKTLEALRVPGLFFVGEVVDVTGHLGGFNFQWAWASGHAAGEVA
jgi:predicted Rossmann fold flavoprotein